MSKCHHCSSSATLVEEIPSWVQTKDGTYLTVTRAFCEKSCQQLYYIGCLNDTDPITHDELPKEDDLVFKVLATNGGFHCFSLISLYKWVFNYTHAYNVAKNPITGVPFSATIKDEIETAAKTKFPVIFGTQTITSLMSVEKFSLLAVGVTTLYELLVYHLKNEVKVVVSVKTAMDDTRYTIIDILNAYTGNESLSEVYNGIQSISVEIIKISMNERFSIYEESVSYASNIVYWILDIESLALKKLINVMANNIIEMRTATLERNFNILQYDPASYHFYASVLISLITFIQMYEPHIVQLIMSPTIGQFKRGLGTFEPHPNFIRLFWWKKHSIGEQYDFNKRHENVIPSTLDAMRSYELAKFVEKAALYPLSLVRVILESTTSKISIEMAMAQYLIGEKKYVLDIVELNYENAEKMKTTSLAAMHIDEAIEFSIFDYCGIHIHVYPKTDAQLERIIYFFLTHHVVPNYVVTVEFLKRHDEFN